MAGYQRKSIQILGGGFNCLPPADKVPVTDYLLAQNWRVDRQGALVSRFGYSSKFSIAGAGMAHSAAVHGGIDGDYYVGCNSQFGLALTSSLYWNFNPTAIATGFDGNRIGLAAMNGWMYVMNRCNQGRHQAALGATAMQTWNLAPPTTSATAAAASTPSTVTSVTYAYACLGGPVYTHSLTINGTRYTCNDGYIVPWTGVWVGYTALTIALLLCQAAQLDPNCSVQPGATAGQVLITPLVAGAVVAVTGSDGNAAASLSVGDAGAGLPGVSGHPDAGGFDRGAAHTTAGLRELRHAGRRARQGKRCADDRYGGALPTALRALRAGHRSPFRAGAIGVCWRITGHGRVPAQIHPDSRRGL
jgi:hypothetical protein